MDGFDDMPPATDEQPQQQDNGFEYVAEQQQQQDAQPAIMSMPDPEPVGEDALTIFTKKWTAELEVKRAAEHEEEKKSRDSAREELSNWQTQRGIRLTAKKESNRSEEQVLVETLESEAEVLKTWDRVTKLIDASAEKTEDKGSDVSRMRTLFIQLKNEPLETTRGAALEAK